MKDFDLEVIQFFAERFNPLPTNDDFLDARYEWQKNDNGSEWPYYRFLYHITSMLRPKFTVELGGYQGSAAAHMAAGWKYGIVVTIDHHTDPGDDLNQEKMLKACKQHHNLVYLQGWSNGELTMSQKGKHALGDAPNAYVDVVAYDKKIDILFIDSWHNYTYAMLDWQVYKPLLNSPALVICDDIIDGDDPEAPISGMMEFWNKLPEPKFLNFNLHPGTGMGFVKV